MEKRPLLSVVVPTKNRYKYLYELIEVVNRLNSNEVELLIHDNTEDNSEFLSYLQNNIHPFINYYHKKESISMTENCDLAVIKSTGEYICLLGDDDGFCDTIIDAVEFMKNHEIDNLLSAKTFYNWPDFYDPSIFNLSSSIEYKKGCGKLVWIDSLAELKKCINNGFDSLYKMPRAYQSLISRECMNRVWNIYGTFFPGPSPDMANAVALSLINPRCAYWDAPLVFSGQSRSVGGGERLMNSNKLKKLTDVPIMPSDVLELWDPILPQYWCADSIWPQSAIQALNGDKRFTINYELILARFVFYHSSYYSECKSLAPSPFMFHIQILFFLCKKIVDFLSHRVSYFISNGKKLGSSTIIRGVDDILNAIDILSRENPFVIH